MTTVFGTLTFPHDPKAIKYQQPREIKIVGKKTRKYAPILLNFGPMIKVVKLEGIFAETGKDADYVETTWIKPLQQMAERPFGIPRLLGDDDMVARGYFSASGSATVSDSTEQVMKGDNSLKIVTTAANAGASRSWTEDQNWSTNDFITVWLYPGVSTTFYVELYDGTNISTQSVVVTSGSFVRHLFLLENFTGIDLSKIRRITYYFADTGTYYIDRNVVGVGFYLNTVGTRYDGLYNIRKFSFDETYKALAYFPYELELYWVDDYY